MEARIPEIVATHVMRAIDSIRSIQSRIHSYIDVDTRFGGDGRYEAECYLSLADELSASQATIREFKRLASKNGIDPELQLKCWGGVPNCGLTMRARDYIDGLTERDKRYNYSGMIDA